MQRSTIGVGPALRKARQARGVSIDQASRDTRIRIDLLEALEGEQFDRLLGDVYVRGCLRSYSSYLGLPADRVVSAYASHADEPEPHPQALLPQTEPVLGAPRRRDNLRLWVMIAATLLLVAAAFGVLSSRASAPPPADLPSAPPLAEVPLQGRTITVGVLAHQEVVVTVTIDGAEPADFRLQPGESRSFEAESSLTIRLDHGGTTKVIVSGKDYGLPGKQGHPWKRTFSFDLGSPSPSPAG